MSIGHQIWLALFSDPKIDSGSQLMRVLQPFVESIPEALSNSLSDSVTASSLEATSILFARYCLENGLVRKVVDLIPPNELGYDGKETIVLTREGYLLQLIVGRERKLSRLSQYMQEKGLTDSDIVLPKIAGLSSEFVAKYQEGSLTILDLLLVQPRFIISGDRMV